MLQVTIFAMGVLLGLYSLSRWGRLSNRGQIIANALHSFVLPVVIVGCFYSAIELHLAGVSNEALRNVSLEIYSIEKTIAYLDSMTKWFKIGGIGQIGLVICIFAICILDFRLHKKWHLRIVGWFKVYAKWAAFLAVCIGLTSSLTFFGNGCEYGTAQRKASLVKKKQGLERGYNDQLKQVKKLVLNC